MSEQSQATRGRVWWNELMTRDVLAARRYYESICGWEFTSHTMPNGVEYFLGQQDGRPIIGMMDMAAMPELAEISPHWFTYLTVADLESALETTTAQGGSVKRAPFMIDGVGRIAIICDPSGAAVGIVEPLSSPK